MFTQPRISPEQAAAALEVGQHLKMEITKYKKQGRLEIKFIKVNPNETYDVGEVVDLLANQFAGGFGQVFGMKGKIIDVV